MKVAPTKIMEIFEVENSNRPRRDPQYFSNSYYRLVQTEKSLFYVGPRLYNKTVNVVNETLPDKELRLQKMFMRPFKNTVSGYLLRTQMLSETENGAVWEHNNNNFTLYTSN